LNVIDNNGLWIGDVNVAYSSTDIYYVENSSGKFLIVLFLTANSSYKNKEGIYLFEILDSTTVELKDYYQVSNPSSYN